MTNEVIIFKNEHLEFEIPCADMPDWANWIAVDSGGAVFAYSNLPSLGKFSWGIISPSPCATNISQLIMNLNVNLQHCWQSCLWEIVVNRSAKSYEPPELGLESVDIDGQELILPLTAVKAGETVFVIRGDWGSKSVRVEKAVYSDSLAGELKAGKVFLYRNHAVAFYNHMSKGIDELLKNLLEHPSKKKANH